MALNRKRRWSREEEETLRAGLAQRVPARQLAKKLERTELGLRMQAHKMGLSWKVGESELTLRVRLSQLLSRGSMTYSGGEFIIQCPRVGTIGCGTTVEEAVRDAESRAPRHLLRPAAKA